MSEPLTAERLMELAALCEELQTIEAPGYIEGIEAIARHDYVGFELAAAVPELLARIAELEAESAALERDPNFTVNIKPKVVRTICEFEIDLDQRPPKAREFYRL